MKKKYIKINDTYRVIVEDYKDLSEKEIKDEINNAINAIEDTEDINDIFVKDYKLTADKLQEWYDYIDKEVNDNLSLIKVLNSLDKKDEEDIIVSDLMSIEIDGADDPFEDTKKEILKEIEKTIQILKNRESETKRTNLRHSKLKVGQIVHLDPTYNSLVNEELLSDDYKVIGFWYKEKLIDEDVSPEDLMDFAGIQIENNRTGKKYNINRYQLTDSKVKDIPYTAPEEEVVIVHSPKNVSGTSPLTIAMVETAYNEIGEKGFENFKSLADMMIKSLKEDLNKMDKIRSNETKAVRENLLDDYVRLERLCQKAKYDEVLPQLGKDINDLSEGLDLNWFKKPNFTPRTYKSKAQELRQLHKKDSNIKKKVKAEFIITPTIMKQLYNDIKNEENEEYKKLRFDRFVSALKGGVLKDINADYDRIVNEEDTYAIDPFIKQAIPEIIIYYESILKYVNDLKDTDLGKENNLEEYAEDFSKKLDIIKEAWLA